MFRPSTNSTVANKTAGGNATKTSPSKQVLSNSDSTSGPAIREIRSRAIAGGSPNANSARQLLAARRQAMSMERLNGGTTPRATPSASMSNISSLSDNKSDRLSSPNNGSSNSISGSAASSPSRGSSKGDGGGSGTSGGLNRTASRVSRFRSAKAVFERLSSVNSSGYYNNNSSTSKHGPVNPPVKGTVASRYAAAAAARGVLGQQALQSNNSQQSGVASPRSRIANNQRMSPLSGIKSPKQDSHQPKPQPRVITTATRRTPIITTASQISAHRSGQATATSDQPGSKIIAPRVTPTKLTNSNTTSSTINTNTNQAASMSKPPPKDLIDKIVSEIVRDANQEHDANCTIQDLSNCDISGIPETLDFDKCFQDIEMMTEEEARKLLSRNPDSPSLSMKPDSDDVTRTKLDDVGDQIEPRDVRDQPLAANQNVDNVAEPDENVASKEALVCIPTEHSLSVEDSDQKQSTSTRFKVRFSEEPATVYDTHAASDYDRRNDDIDPVAASAEYEIEKSRERDGLTRDDEGDDDEQQLAVTMMQMATGRTAVGAVIQRFNNQTNQQQSIMKTFEDFQAGSHSQQVAGAYPRAQLIASPGETSGDTQSMMTQQQQNRLSHNFHQSNRVDSFDNQNLGDDEDQLSSQKEYIESLEREVGLKRILEQNLRDLQSQYYETVKQLDSYKSDAEVKLAQLEGELANSREQHESTQSELADVREQSNQNEIQLNDIKESSQLLEKKYHRAKRIIKDMQSREESFTKREQLYQQKLDEIEFELGVLIQAIDWTIYEDGLKYFSLLSLDANGAQSNNCSSQHQTRLDVLGLIKRMMENFSNSKKTQSAQIRQRIVTMLEQQLANLLASSNGCASVTAGPVFPIHPVATQNSGQKPVNSSNGSNSMNNNNNNNNNDDQRQNQNYSYASHRLSQPNMPHPIGVGGQPTKIFHSNMPAMGPIILNEPSPPQSVNSYPSTNSLNSLNIVNNNNQQQAGSKQLIDSTQPQGHEDAHIGARQTAESFDPIKTTNTSQENNAHVPYETNEWHDKPVSEWTTTQVSTWLLALGLDQYISKFEDRNVNGQSLINLDSTVLKGLGVLNSNDRNLLKKKIRELRSEMEKERKMMEKKMKENLKEKSKGQNAASVGNNANQSASNQNNRHSWKKGLLS